MSRLRRDSRLWRLIYNGIKLVPVMPVVFVVGAAALNFILINPAKPSSLPDYSDFSEALINPSLLLLRDSALYGDSSPMGEIAVADSQDDFAGFVLEEMSSYLNTAPATNATVSRNGLLVYMVAKGDTISTLAASFGISVNTIVWANNIKGSIRPGQEIVILPVSGILHEVKPGETIDSIAAFYNIPGKLIATFNKTKVAEGDTVIIPNAKPVKSNYVSPLPSSGNYLTIPVKGGWNWGRLHDNNAVDISAACGTPVYASAEGLVVDVGSPKDWNEGYGGFVKLKHPLNNIETFYAHTSVNSVSVGDYVSQGNQIAKVGKTGKVQGPTGCHVHFAVSGAKNPFVK